YYVLVGARDQRDVFRSSLQLAETLLKEAQARHRAGMATKLDLLQGEVGVANARLGLLQAENAVKASEDALLALIGQFELDTPPGPTAAADEPLSDVNPSVEQSFALALENLPELRNARTSIELARLELAQARDGLKPFLDLDLSFGLGGEDFSGSGAFSGAFDSQRTSWIASLSFTYPLGRVGEKARFRQAQLSLDRSSVTLRQLEQDILV